MPDSPRLAELRRQRALVQEHLAWLDREIEAATAAGPVQHPAASRPGTQIPVVSATAMASPAEADADAILDQYRTPPDSLQRDVRKGCLLYFVGAFVLLCALVGLLYFALRH